MQPKSISDILRSLGWWFDHVERLGKSRDLLHHRMVDLIAWVSQREKTTPEHAVELLRSGYLFQAVEAAINNENNHRG